MQFSANKFTGDHSVLSYNQELALLDTETVVFYFLINFYSNYFDLF